jgi:hypothetical protein
MVFEQRSPRTIDRCVEGQALIGLTLNDSAPRNKHESCSTAAWLQQDGGSAHDPLRLLCLPLLDHRQPNEHRLHHGCSANKIPSKFSAAELRTGHRS